MALGDDRVKVGSGRRVSELLEYDRGALVAFGIYLSRSVLPIESRLHCEE